MTLKSKFRTKFVDKLEGVQRKSTKTIRGMQLNWPSLFEQLLSREHGSITESVARGSNIHISEGGGAV